MSTRKPTIDDMDDVDDEDGVLEDEVVEESDLTLVVETAEEVAKDPDELDEEEV